MLLCLLDVSLVSSADHVFLVLLQSVIRLIIQPLTKEAPLSLKYKIPFALVTFLGCNLGPLALLLPYVSLRNGSIFHNEC